MLAQMVADFTARKQNLEILACPTEQDLPFFKDQMAMAEARGLSEQESLEFVVWRRADAARQAVRPANTLQERPVPERACAGSSRCSNGECAKSGTISISFAPLLAQTA